MKLVYAWLLGVPVTVVSFFPMFAVDPVEVFRLAAPKNSTLACSDTSRVHSQDSVLAENGFNC